MNYKSGVLFSMLILVLFSLSHAHAQEKTKIIRGSKQITIMGLGDSITEGGDTFHSYLFPLWERLFTEGYYVDFIGPRSSKCRIGKINHCGFSGKNAEFLETVIDSIYRKFPADVVLLHSGHNHFSTENPVDGIIEAQKSIINKILAINASAKVLVAKVVENGKLPKYSYIPELNKHIEKMVRNMNLSNVILVDQSKKFDWKKHSISDKVHPNTEGAKVMADVWFETVKQVLPSPEQSFHPEIVSYKTVEQGNLNVHIFKPEQLLKNKKYPAIVFFFAGGWSVGTPLQFYRECAYYSSKGMVAITADYRITSVNKSSVFESVEDAKDVMRWIRRNAKHLKINPDQIVSAGSSAGGHLAAATGTLRNAESASGINYKPNLMVLYYPVVDSGENGYGPEMVKKRYNEISPIHNIDSTTPPALFILGNNDPLIPVKTAETFQARMEENGVYCELHLIEGAGHPIFYYAKEKLSSEFYTIRELTNNFLQKYGYLKD